jgi:hypothetical protein
MDKQQEYLSACLSSAFGFVITEGKKKIIVVLCNLSYLMCEVYYSVVTVCKFIP